METLHDTLPQIQGQEALNALRQRASLLVSQSESEELLAEAVAILSGRPLPCIYTHEQMESALLEAETDYQNGRFVSHSSICERYGILDESVDKTKTIIVDVNGNEIVFRN